MATTGRGRIAPLIALAALLLSVLAPMAAFADSHTPIAPIGPDGSFAASDNANPTTVCTALRDHLQLDSSGTVSAERVDWPPEEQTAQTQQLAGFSYIVLKSGQVYEYFDFTPDGYDGELLRNGDATDFNISNITGCDFGATPPTDVDVVVSKSWIDRTESSVDWPSGFTVDVEVELFEADSAGDPTGTALGSATLTLDAATPTRTEVFSSLVEDRDYVITWAETGQSMTGATAGCAIETFIGAGDEAFTAGVDDEVSITAVNTFDCPDSSTVTASKTWEQDGSTVGAPAGFAPTFEIELYRIGEGEQAVALDDDVLEPGEQVSLGELGPGEYRLEWTETGIDFDSTFSNAAGETCSFVESETSGMVLFDTFGLRLAAQTSIDYYYDDYYGNPEQQDISFTAVNRFDCEPGEEPESVTVAIDKVWDGVGADEVGTSPQFDVTLGARTRTIGVDGTATFGGLVAGASYTVDWTELSDALPAVFENEAGQTCTFALEDSTTEGSETFVAGAVDSLTFEAVNLYSCVDDEVLIAIPVQVDKVWATADGDGQETVATPDEAAVTFTVDLYDGDDVIDTVADLAPGDSHVFEQLPQEGDYSVAWTEQGAPATITVDDLDCAISSTEGDTAGTVDEGFVITVTNLYECEEPVSETQVLGVTETRETLSETGVSAILLSLMGLLGIGLGGGMLRRARRED